MGKMRPKAGEFFVGSDAGARPTAAEVPGTLGLLIDEVSSPPPKTGETPLVVFY